MMLRGTEDVLNVHVKYADRDGVIHALTELGVVQGNPVPVWPPRRLPFGVLVSPERNGWISIWSPLQNTRDWFSDLTATLECVGVLFEIVEGQYWISEFYQHGSRLGVMELPTEAVEYDDLWARTTESLENEGVSEPWEDEARFGARMDEIAAGAAYREDLEHFRSERLPPAALRHFLPPTADADMAWQLLTAIDRETPDGSEDDETSPFVEDFVDQFAAYIGILDATWDMRADEELLSEGDYEDLDGMPEGWKEFVVVPVPYLPVL